MGKQTFVRDIVLVFGVAVVDRLTKMWALIVLASGDISCIPGITFSLSFNRGISFGLFHSTSPWIFGTVTFAIVLGLSLFVAYAFRTYKAYASGLPFLLVVIGGISNVVDRFLYGGVIDFIDLHIGTWHWPTFNIADGAIVCGIVWLIRRLMYHDIL